MPVSSLVVPDYVQNAGSFINWISSTFEKSHEVLNLQQIKQLWSLAKDYGIKITADLSGHAGTNWSGSHLHFGNSRVHIAIAEEAFDWIEKC